MKEKMKAWIKLLESNGEFWTAEVIKNDYKEQFGEEYKEND